MTQLRVNIANPTLKLTEGVSHTTTVNLAELNDQPLDYGWLDSWVQRMQQADKVALTADENGRPVKFVIKPGSFSINKYRSMVKGKVYDTTADDACIAMMGVRTRDNQPVCISLSVAPANGSYVAVTQPVAV